MKKIFSIVTVLLIIFSVACFANITDPGAYDPGTTTPTEILGIGNKIVGAFQVFGTIFAVGTLALIGIRIMIASPSEKADLKGRLTPYIVGAVMLFSIVNLLQIIYEIVGP